MATRENEPSDHPLLVAPNRSHDRIVAALKAVAGAIGGPDVALLSVEWDAAAAAVRATSLALLDVPIDEGRSAAVADLAARYLDLALWMEENHPRPRRSADGRPMVVSEWQRQVSDPAGPFWGELMVLYADAQRLIHPPRRRPLRFW